MQAIQRSMTETPNQGSPAGGAGRRNSSPGQGTLQEKAVRLAELRTMMCDPGSMSIEDQMELAMALSMEESEPKGDDDDDDGDSGEKEEAGPTLIEGDTEEANVVPRDARRAALQIGVPRTPSPPAKEKPSGRSPRLTPPKPASPSDTDQGGGGEQEQEETRDGQDVLGRIGEALRAPSPVLQAVPIAASSAPAPTSKPARVNVPDVSASDDYAADGAKGGGDPGAHEWTDDDDDDDNDGNSVDSDLAAAMAMSVVVQETDVSLKSESVPALNEPAPSDPSA